MHIRHPRAHPDVPGKPPAKFDSGDYVSDLDADGTFHESEHVAEHLMAHFGVPREVVDASVPVEDAVVDTDTTTDGDVVETDATTTGGVVEAGASIKAGECPWCEDYQGEHVGQHASSAHPEAWAAYQEANS